MINYYVVIILLILFIDYCFIFVNTIQYIVYFYHLLT